MGGVGSSMNNERSVHVGYDEATLLRAALTQSQSVDRGPATDI
jgi:hypothetical protein